MATRILFVGDIHAADRPPAGRVDGYREQILAKLEQIMQAAQGADAVVLLGDIFHQPRANLVSHGLVKDLIRVFSDYPCPVYAVIGNHDQGEEGLDSIYRQPLGVLKEAGAVIIPDAGGAGIGQVALVFRHYFARRDADPNYYALNVEVHPKRPCVLVAHGSILPPGEVRPYPTVCVTDIPNVERYCLVVSGHIHEDMGITELPGGGYFANLGSVGRVSRTQGNLTRTPRVLSVTWEGDDVAFDTYELTESTLPASQVFRVPEATDSEDASDEIKLFASALSAGLASESVDVRELVESLEGSPAAKAHLIRLLIQAGAL